MSFVVPSGSIVTQKYAWKTHQIKIDKNPPVITALNEVFDKTGGVRLVSLIAKQTNTETDGKEIDILITKDGTTYTYDSSDIGQLVNNKDYAICIITGNTDEAAYVIDVVDVTIVGGSSMLLGYGITVEGKPLEGHDIKVEVRLTNAAGTAQRLYAKATYETLEAV